MPFTIDYVGHQPGVPLSYFTGASVTLVPRQRFVSTPTLGDVSPQTPLPEHDAAMRLGRRANNAVRVASAAVAPQHLLLYQTPAGVFAVDLRSTNGTTLDGAPLVPGRATPVQLGATLRLAGGFDFVLSSVR